MSSVGNRASIFKSFTDDILLYIKNNVTIYIFKNIFHNSM